MPSATLSPGADANLANAYAIALASAAAAADRCEGMMPDSNTLVALKSAAKMTDGDDAWIAQKFEALKPQIQGALLKNGATQWCSATWELFGPSGLGAIRR